MNEMTTIKKQDFFPANIDSAENNAFMQDLDGLDVTFERIKVPSGGAISFEIPSIDSETPEQIQELEVVILHHHPLRVYYEQEYTGANMPPDCSSLDGVSGAGSPGGSCKHCMYNRFGTGKNNSKACKSRRRLFILRRGELFPMLFELPTTSLKEFGGYIRKLVYRGKQACGVITKIALKKVQNNNGIPYSQATFSLVRDLTSEELEALAPLHQLVIERMDSIGYEPLDDLPPEFIEEVAPSDAMPYNVDPQTGEVLQMTAF